MTLIAVNDFESESSPVKQLAKVETWRVRQAAYSRQGSNDRE